MNRNGIYVRVLLVVMVLAVLISFVGRSSHAGPRDSWVPSSFNPVGAGNLAFYETLEDMHWPVARWREPLSRLSAQGTGNALIITRSAIDWRVAFTGQEDDLLDDWVKRGNTLILCGRMARWDDTRKLLDRLGFHAPAERDTASFLKAWRMAPEKKIIATPAAGQTGRLALPEGAALPVTYAPGTKVLWSGNGVPTVLEFPRGLGRVVCVASAQVLSNRYLAQDDDLAIVLGLLAPNGQAPAHLFFEETHHGYVATFAVARLVNHPGVRLAVLLALLGAATFFGSAFVRFGPVLPLERTPGRSSLEFIDSIAELYHRSDLRNDMMRFLFDDAHRQILLRLNLPPGAPHELIASRLRQAHPELPGWKKLAQRFDSQDYVAGLPPGGWLRVARELIQIKTALA